MAPDLDDPVERRRERAAAIAFWVVLLVFAVLGTIWFMLFRQ
jgi:type VI protein secretion system component VasF